ncbi:hypothetical protein CIPAW_05G144800 [Carya illinoinensis]|uniref:Uncharacterized protein n=1 Tax=Carya illinoinensis TaxID=32201 RepID=A0A8T1QIS7_CARIL|nr:hypothetical protein CIPAW_05G144800 [Carya illinoinensis]
MSCLSVSPPLHANLGSLISFDALGFPRLEFKRSRFCSLFIYLLYAHGCTVLSIISITE